MTLQLNSATKREILGGMIDVGSTYETVTLRLTKAALSVGPDTVLADCTAIQATFPGYAASAAVVWGTIFDSPDGSAAVLGDLKQWDCTSDADPQDIFACYWTAGGVLVGFEAFDASLPARNAFDAIPYLPRLSFA